MKFTDIITISFRNLFRQKARTFLTIISVMVGAFLVSIMLSIGNGLERFMVSQVTMFSNTRTIGVQKSFDAGNVGFGLGGIQEFEEVEQEEIQDQDVDEDESKIEAAGEDVPGETDSGTQAGASSYVEEAMLSKEDLDEISQVDHVEEASFESIVASDYARLDGEEGKKLKVSLYGMPIGIREDLTFSVVNTEILEQRDSLVLSDSYAEEWNIDREDLVGETVWVRVTRSGNDTSAAMMMGAGTSGAGAVPDPETREFEFTIAGFVEKSLLAQVGFITSERSNEMNAYISDKAVEEYAEDEKAFEIVVIVDNEENVSDVDKAIEDLGYESMTYDETLGQIGVVFDVINAVLSSFGVIAMVVASIGIVNTLLMAIYERTREIGVMKAVGATRGVIGLLFTAEAAWLGFWGGVFGLSVSWLLGRLVNSVLHNGIAIGGFTLIEGYLKDYPTFDISVFTLMMVLIVMAITTGVAVVAGLYPSWRASRLDPIDALRHD